MAELEKLRQLGLAMLIGAGSLWGILAPGQVSWSQQATDSNLHSQALSEGLYLVPSSSEVWKDMKLNLPELPVWARTFAHTLPRTTEAMLALDDLHRRNNPLGNRLAGLVRWKVAETLQSKYGVAYAQYDLERTGLDEDELAQLAAGTLELSETQQLCLRLGKKLTLAGYSIQDEEIQNLVNRIGPDDTVALVQTVAFANFQIRLCFAVDAQLEEGGPLASVSPMASSSAPEPGEHRKTMDELFLAETTGEYQAPANWRRSTDLQWAPKMQQQTQRQSRIALPEQYRIDALDEEDQKSANRITWSRVAHGYQPVMTRAWFRCLRAYQQEARPDEVFLNSVFWVVTRSNECFY